MTSDLPVPRSLGASVRKPEDIKEETVVPPPPSAPSLREPDGVQYQLHLLPELGGRSVSFLHFCHLKTKDV